MLPQISKTVYHALSALKNPTKQESVAAVGELLYSTTALNKIRQKMLLSKNGRKILKTRPLISSSTINLSNLNSLPHTTFGYNYNKFLKSENVSPDTRTKVTYINDPELAYIMTRYRQIHDFLHTLTNVPTTLEGEIGLKWFEFRQSGLPMNLFAGLFGGISSLWFKEERSSERLFDLIQWGIQAGLEAEFLMNVDWEEKFEVNLGELRKELRIITFK